MNLVEDTRIRDHCHLDLVAAGQAALQGVATVAFPYDLSYLAVGAIHWVRRNHEHTFQPSIVNIESPHFLQGLIL